MSAPMDPAAPVGTTEGAPKRSTTPSGRLTREVVTIFLSSTFRDMHAERDHLRIQVLPELSERLRPHGLRVEVVDFRQGLEVSEPDGSSFPERLVLSACLSEINRCAPFFLSLIGERYGWIPAAESSRWVAQEHGLQGDVVELSITDLEIRFALSAGLAQSGGLRAYLRGPLPVAVRESEEASLFLDTQELPSDPADRGQPLKRLRQCLRTMLEGTGRIRDYAVEWDSCAHRVNPDSLGPWGQQVLEDLWEDIAREFGLQSSGEGSFGGTGATAERMLDAFVKQQTASFVGRETLVAALLDVARGNEGDRRARASSVRRGRARAHCSRASPPNSKRTRSTAWSCGMRHELTRERNASKRRCSLAGAAEPRFPAATDPGIDHRAAQGVLGSHRDSLIPATCRAVARRLACRSPASAHSSRRWLPN